MEELTKASHKLAEEVYKQAAGQAAGGRVRRQGRARRIGRRGQEAAAGKKDDDVIDAEFREEKKDKSMHGRRAPGRRLALRLSSMAF